MSELDDDIMRGCLKNGEPIEAKWGQGWWSVSEHEPDYEQDEYQSGECPFCKMEALYNGDQFVECEHCHKNYADLEVSE
jgi:hypothetical protein